MAKVKAVRSVTVLFRCRSRCLVSCAGRRSRRGNLRRLDAVKLGEILFEIGVALIRDLILVRACAVAAVKIFAHVHTGGYLPEWSEALAAMVEPAIAAQVDKNLCRARIWISRLSERNRTLGIGLRDRIVLDVGALPGLIDSRAPCQSELHYEPGNDPKKLDAVEIAVLDQIVKSIGFIWSPRTRDLHDEISLRGRESGFVNVRRFVLESCRMQ